MEGLSVGCPKKNPITNQIKLRNIDYTKVKSKLPVNFLLDMNQKSRVGTLIVNLLSS